jgi:hypothetical protein
MMQSNIIINKSLHGVLLYGTASGYRELVSINLENTRYLDDLIDISNSFDLSTDTTIVSVTAGKDQITIFTLYSRIEDGKSRDGFYAISLFYYGLIPHSNLVFEQLFLFQQEFNKQILENNEIQISRIEKIQNLVENIPELSRKVQPKKSGSHISVIQMSNNIIYDDINNGFLNSFIDEVNWGKSLFISKLGLLKANKIYSSKDGSFYAEDTIIFDKFSAFNELEKERITKRFSFNSLSNKNTIVPGTLTLQIGDKYAEYKIYNTSLPIEFVVEDNAEVRLTFIPDDSIKYERYEETKPFTQLTGYQGSTLNLKIEEKQSKKFEIKSDVNIYGLKVICNGAEIIPEYEQYKIYDQSGTIQITSTSHLPQNVDIKDININSTITLLSNNIELEIYDGNTKIPISKDIEVIANGNRLSTNYLSRADLPIRIEIKTKKYFKNNPLNIPKDFIDSKYPIYLKNISENYIGIGSKKGRKNSGIIAPDKPEPWYSTSKGKFSLIGILFLTIVCFTCIKFLAPISNSTKVNSTFKIQVLCKKDTTCENSTIDTTTNVSQTQTTFDNNNDLNEDSNLSSGSSAENPKTKIEGNEKISCKNFKEKPLEEQKSFCADVENKNCEYCKPSCNNYNHLPKETQKAYCNNPDTNCNKCPPNESQNASRIQNGGTKSESETTQVDCSHLDGVSGKSLENLCKNVKNKSCEKCKNINKK